MSEKNTIDLGYGFEAEVKEYLTVNEVRGIQKRSGLKTAADVSIDDANKQSDELAKVAVLSLTVKGKDEPLTDGDEIVAAIGDMPLDAYMKLSAAIEKLLEPALKKAEQTSTAT